MTTHREVARAVAAMAAIVAVGLLLRLWHLGRASLWNDELFSRFYADAGLKFMWTTGFRIETTPPTYYTLLVGWMKLAGHSEFALRLPSVIASTLVIPIVGLIGRDIGGWSCGLVAALIFAVAPMELYYAQEARAYAFMLLPLAGMLWCGLRLLRGMEAGGRGGAPLAGYAAAAAAAIYVHNTSVLIVAAAGLTGAGVLLARPDLRAADARRWWRMAAAWSAANAAAGVLSLPVLLAIVAQVHANRLSWMQPTTFWDVRASLATLITGPATTPLLLQTVLALAVAGMLGLSLLGSRRADRAVIAVLIAVPLLNFLLIVGSSLRQPILVPRLLCWMWLPLAVLLALLMTTRTKARLGLIHGGLVAATVVALAVGLGFQLRQDASAKEPWKLLLPRIGPLLAQAELVVTGPWTDPMGLKYYGADMSHVAQWSENHVATIENTTIQLMLEVPDMSRAQLETAIRSGRRVVLIQRSVEAKYLALLQVPAPAGVVAQHCWALGTCMAAMYWGMKLPAGR